MSESAPEGRDYCHITKGCFGCGTENSAGLRLRPWREGEYILAEYEPQAHHRGFTKVVHGGLIAALLDEMTTTAVAVFSNEMTATKTLEIQFLAPMKLEGRYSLRSRYTGKHDDGHTAEGEILDSTGKAIAKARGQFAILSVEKFAKKFLT